MGQEGWREGERERGREGERERKRERERRREGEKRRGERLTFELGSREVGEGEERE